MFTFVSAVSLVLCLVAGAWAMWGRWSLDWRLGGWEYSVNGSVGKVRAGRQRGLPWPVQRREGMHPVSLPQTRVDWWHGDWIAVRSGSQDYLVSGAAYRQRYSTVEVSATALVGVAVAALLVAFGAVGVRRVRGRRRAGSCAKCAYDLTGNVSGVCPECGMPAAGAAT